MVTWFGNLKSQCPFLSSQVNLVIGDFFKSKSPLLQYTEKAAELITWLRGKSRILDHLPYAVIRPVLTRWTAHYMAYRQLLLLSGDLRSLVLAEGNKLNDDKLFEIGDSSTKAKARKMTTIIKDNVFWHNIAL